MRHLRELKTDNRPARFRWAPGDYYCSCTTCGEKFSGDKRSTMCADCAYDRPVPETPLERMARWDHRFLELAAVVASWSKDPSTKVGAVIVRPDMTIASLGYNGFPRGMPDLPELLDDREYKLRYVVHAEANAITTAREPLHGYTLYTTLQICGDCCKLAIQAGIARFVSYQPSEEHKKRWAGSFSVSERMIRETKKDMTLYRRPDFVLAPIFQQAASGPLASPRNTSEQTPT